eukprot:scaffold107219_cov32-Attheya_sp.AAC.1
MANTSTHGKNNADGVPRAKRICPFCGKMGHTTIRSSSCAHNPKVIAATQDHVTSVASSTQEVPPLLPPAAQPAPPIATNDAVHFESPPATLTQDFLTSVASTQEVPPLLPAAAQPAPHIATNDAVRFESPPATLTLDFLTSVASSTQEGPPLLPPASQPAPPIATNDAVRFEPPPAALTLDFSPLTETLYPALQLESTPAAHHQLRQDVSHQSLELSLLATPLLVCPAPINKDSAAKIPDTSGITNSDMHNPKPTMTYHHLRQDASHEVEDEHDQEKSYRFASNVNNERAVAAAHQHLPAHKRFIWCEDPTQRSGTESCRTSHQKISFRGKL